MADEDKKRIRRALVSVSDKTGLIELVQQLVALDIDILSTGGTARILTDAGLAVTEVSDVTDFPEILDGRVKTLHPRVHGGILARRSDPDHQQTLTTHNIEPIDLLVVNLYPFEQTRNSEAGYDTIVENIDIGGPCLLRAGAKNHKDVAVLSNPDQYADFIEELKHNGGASSISTRKQLACQAFAHTAAYDTAIAAWLETQCGQSGRSQFSVGGRALSKLRYGENPHQSAILYANNADNWGIATAAQLQGKALSYNNLLDADGALKLICEFSPQDSAAVAIIKHGNPCGVGTASTLSEAYRKALDCDPQSAFGGIVAVNQQLDEVTAKSIANLFTEVVVAPKFESAALDILSEKPNLRLLETGVIPESAIEAKSVRLISGGLLVQDQDNGVICMDNMVIATKRSPTDQQLDDMVMAMKIAKHVHSNAIVLVKDGASVGIGAGQMSRVDAVHIATRKAGKRADNCVAASDAFFPFADGIEGLASAGVVAIIQPGGSQRDGEVVEAASNHNMVMVTTGMRHFRH